MKPFKSSPGIAWLFVSVAWVAAAFDSAGAAPFDPGKIDFEVRVGTETGSYRVLGVFVLPKEKLEIEILKSLHGERFALHASDGVTQSDGGGHWTWRAPAQPGLYPLEIHNLESDERMRLNVFVMIPLDRIQNGMLNGYRIGTYPARAANRPAIYDAPAGLIEVTEANRATLVSPHFRIEQFLCKQDSGYPKYLALRSRLVLKLEAILEISNRAGHRCDTFHIMSGYRTPFYNHEIGNVRYSRHLWGGAADIFIDVDPEDGMMDDLNRDGRIDYRDAEILYDLIDREYGKAWYKRFVGGLARYKKTTEHGPFVHVDVRGFHARWGR